jgi:hypothetical protein
MRQVVRCIIWLVIVGGCVFLFLFGALLKTPSEEKDNTFDNVSWKEFGYEIHGLNL